MNVDGSLDTSFDQTGTGLDDGVRSMAVQSDGKILVGGTFTSYDGTPYASVTRVLGGQAGAPGFAAAPEPVGFGDQTVGSTSAARAVTVTNTGTADLVFGTGAVTRGGADPDQYAITSDTCSHVTVTAGGTCTAAVTFRPTAPGAKSATLVFTDNASGSPQHVALTGTGAAAPTPTSTPTPTPTPAPTLAPMPTPTVGPAPAPTPSPAARSVVKGWPTKLEAKRGKAMARVTLTPAYGRSGTVQKQVCKTRKKCTWTKATTVIWPKTATGIANVRLTAKKGTKMSFRLVIPGTVTATAITTKPVNVKGR